MDLSKFTAPVILLGLVAGMFFPFFKFFAPALTIIIGIVIFSACLSVDTKSVAETIRKPKYYGVLFFVLFILQPLATWLVARIFVQNPLILAGIVLISAAPPPAGLGFWIHSLKSNVSLALAFISISYIVTPLVIPILAYYLLGSYVHVDVFGIARSLVFIIIIPLALALLLQRFKDVKKYTNVIALPAFFLLIATTIALNASTIFTNTATRKSWITIAIAPGRAARSPKPVIATAIRSTLLRVAVPRSNGSLSFQSHPIDNRKDAPKLRRH